MEPCKTEKPLRISAGCLPSLALLGLFLLAFAWVLFNSRWMGAPSADLNSTEPAREVERDLKAEPDWDAVDKYVQVAVEAAACEGERVVDEGLEAFCANLKTRVHDLFLPWFLGYGTQQKMRWLSLKSTVKGWVLSDAPKCESVLQAFVAQSFQERVLRPPLAQKELELLLDRAVEAFGGTLKANLESIRVKYKIQNGPWADTIKDLSELAVSMPDSRSVELDTKALTAVTALGLVNIVGNTALSGTAEGMASKAGRSVGTVVSRFPILTVVLALWVWDLADHAVTVRRIRPELEESLDAYIDRLKESLAEDPEYGLKQAIGKVAGQAAGVLTKHDDP